MTREPVWWFVVALFFMFGFFGFIGANYARTFDQHDDMDCQIQTSIDERPPQCHETCTTGAEWFIWGERRVCYWDDAPYPEASD